MSAISQVTNEALNAGAHPAVLALAQQMLGQKEYIGWCQQFVEKMGATTSGASAIQAWKNAQNKVQGMQGLQPGDLVYFDADKSNQGYGHTGIYAGDNQFISATDSGIKNNDLNKWSATTGQKMLGYVPQGERQTQQTTPQQPTQKPQFTPVQPEYKPVTVAPLTQSPTMPNQLNAQVPAQSTQTYGRITVPNIQ